MVTGFEAHKEIYLTQFYRPMCALADELYAFMAEQRPDLGLIRKVTRIYRDARSSVSLSWWMREKDLA